MRTVLAIAIKDIRQWTRNLPALMFGLAAPLVLTALIGLAFGGFSGGGPPELQPVSVQAVNLDIGAGSPPVNLGEQLIQTLQGPGQAGLLEIALAADEASARSAVDRREADAALIVPAGFSAAVMSSGEQPAEVVLYHDPGLVWRLPILSGAVQGVLDAYSGSRVARLVTAAQMASRGAPDEAIASGAESAAAQYAQTAAMPLVGMRVESLSHPAAEGAAAVLAEVCAGMLITFTFFTAATTAETILKEDETGTLRRLFTTPAARTTVLGGKLLSVLLITLLQASILVIAAALLFGVRWGDPPGVFLMVLGLVIAASGMSVVLLSFARNTREAGYLIGGALTILGFAGGLFTTGFQNVPKVLDTVALFTPQGWAMRGYRLLLRGESLPALLVPAAICAAAGAVLFLAGSLVFRRRYA